jgi:hypothetical protein
MHGRGDSINMDLKGVRCYDMTCRRRPNTEAIGRPCEHGKVYFDLQKQEISFHLLQLIAS